MNAQEIVKQIAHDHKYLITDDQVEYVIWEQTGFPAFWAIPTDGATPEECFRKQVSVFFDKLGKKP